MDVSPWENMTPPRLPNGEPEDNQFTKIIRLLQMVTGMQTPVCLHFWSLTFYNKIELKWILLWNQASIELRFILKQYTSHLDFLIELW